MASRWRIRHKLLLGVGLVVAIMALLLCGTLRGLWSYYLTTNSIRAKLNELIAAEELKASVADLIHQTDQLIEKPFLLPAAINKARDRLDAYHAQLEDNLAHGRDPGLGIYENELIGRLHEDLKNYQNALAPLLQARVTGLSDARQREEDLKRLRGSTPTAAIVSSAAWAWAGPHGTVADTCSTLWVAQTPTTAVPAILAIQKDAADLRDHIKEELAHRLDESRRHYQVALWILAPTAVLGLLAVIAMLRSFQGWVLCSIHDLETSVGRLAQGDFAHRLDLHSGDEMEDLAQAFNHMAQRLQDLYSDLARQVNERSRQLVRSERLASVGFLAAGVAHEINNPLASIAFCSEALEARLADLFRHLRASGRGVEEHEIFSKYLKMIQEEAFRCKNITERLLAFSRAGERRREEIDLRELIQSVLDLAQTLHHHRGKEIAFEVQDRGSLPGTITAWVHGEEIKSVVLNLVINALDSLDQGGRLTVRLGLRDGLAEIQFTDTGCGMSQQVLDNIFEPFFTRSRSGKGTGLGLTISHSIVSQHGGEIEAFSRGPGTGSTFTVRLPVRPPDAAQPEAGRTGWQPVPPGLAA